MLKWVLLLAIIARFLAEDSITSGGIWSDFMRASPGTFASFVAWGIFHFTHWDAYFDIFALHDELGEVLHATPADSKALMFEEAQQRYEMDEYESPSFSIEKTRRAPRLGWQYHPRLGLPDYVWAAGRQAEVPISDTPMIEFDPVTDSRVLAV